MASPLQGIKVLELCEVYQGPLAGQTLGDFGAEVLKIERPGRGDSLRHSDAIANAQGRMGSYFAATNRNKQSLCLDLKTQPDKEDFLSLVKEADVLLHNYRPGVMEKLGLGFDELHTLNPRLIYAAASGYGETGPFASMMGQDFLIQSVSGIAWKTTSGVAEPTFVNVPIADYASGNLLVQGILLALLERAQSGLGQKVNVSLYSALAAMQSLEAAAVLNYNYDTRWFERAPNFTAQASDGWFTVLGFFRDNPLQLICTAFNLPDLSVSMNLPDRLSQGKHKNEIAAHLSPVFRELTVEHCVSRLQQAGILAAPILTFEEMLAHPQTLANNLVVTVPVTGQEPMRVIANPIQLSRSPAVIRRGPPALNEHSES